MVEIRLIDVRKYFGKVKAVDGVSLDIKDGEFMVLLGPSGCGKTTTLRCIAGLERVNGGSIYFGEKDVTFLLPKDRNVSMVFQSYAVWPHMTVFDNIAFPLKIKKYPKSEIRRKVKWASELLRIDELLDRYPHQLSGGQRQRVAVARAIVVEPDVLLMDEPLSNLDALLRVKMRSELKKLQRNLGVTTVYVTHDQVEAMTMGDRIAIMNRGKILQVGSPEEIYLRPANTFVAGFVGAPQMNFIKMGVVKEGKVIRLNAGPLHLPVPEGVRSALEPYVGGEVIVGIRPEYIYLEGYEPPGVRNSVEVSGIVDFVEPLGSDTIIHLKLGDKTILVKVPRRVKVEVGSRITASFDLDKINIFEEKTGEAVA